MIDRSLAGALGLPLELIVRREQPHRRARDALLHPSRIWQKIKSENMHFGWIEIFLKIFYDFRIVTNYLDLGRSNEAVGVNSTQLSTFICVRAQVTNHCRRERKTRARARRRGVRDGEHLIPACNADEGDGGGDQALDEVRPVAPFLALRRYLILNLS